MDLYVYYRVLASDGPLLAAKLQAMQRALHALHGTRAALKRRPEEKNGCQTWMEVYFQVPDGFPGLLDQALKRADVAGLIQGPRHTEVFVDISPCA